MIYSMIVWLRMASSYVSHVIYTSLACKIKDRPQLQPPIIHRGAVICELDPDTFLVNFWYFDFTAFYLKLSTFIVVYFSKVLI